MKAPLTWAKQKWFGNKEKLAQGMLSWTKDKIHATLVAYPIPDPKVLKDVKKSALRAHDVVLKFMGTKKESKLSKKTIEMLTNALRLPDMRDEVYVQITKQLTNNPQPETIPKGWELMALCLAVFPPSSSLEDFLEKFFRSSAHVQQAEQWKCKGYVQATSFCYVFLH